MSELVSWEVLEAKLLLDRRWLRVREEKIRTGSGVVLDEFHVIESPNWAATICLTEERELVLVEQYRHGHGGLSLEFPAGVVDEGEGTRAAAERELLEETGYVAEDWRSLWRTRPEPARHEQWAEFFVARGARHVRPQDLDPAESVRVVTLPVDSLEPILNRMVHAVHVGALLLAQRRGFFD